MSNPKIPFTITYRRPGTTPPIFVAGTFSEPEWSPQEMHFTKGDDGEYSFEAQVMVEPEAHYQFKIRIGEGDWWALADNYATETDASGNQNNVLNVPKSSIAAPVAANTDTHDYSIPPSHENGSSPPQPRVEITQGVEDEIKTPLFAHECFGAYDFTDTSSDHDTWERDSSRRDSRPRSKDFDFTDVDVNDPTLEKFPSDRSSIFDAIRTIQTHLNEDQTHLDDLPPSPRAVTSRRTSVESIDEMSLSPNPLSPTTARRRESRLSHSSLGRNRSAASLGAIAEEPKPGSQESQRPRKISSTSPKTRPVVLGMKSPSSEEDEAVVMMTSEVFPIDTNDKTSPSHIESTEPQQDEGGLDLTEEVSLGAQDRKIHEPETSFDQPVPEVSEGSGLEPIESKSERTGPPEPTDQSTSLPKDHAPKEGDSENISQRLFQCLFGSKTNVMMTTAIAAIAIGLGWWKGADGRLFDSTGRVR